MARLREGEQLDTKKGQHLVHTWSSQGRRRDRWDPCTGTGTCTQGSFLLIAPDQIANIVHIKVASSFLSMKNFIDKKGCQSVYCAQPIGR